MFSQIGIVLIRTTHSGNLGSVARAMKTMGFTRLYLVDPQADHLDDVAIARASGAEDVLHQARVVDSLEAALVGCHWVAGTSGRRRGLSLSHPCQSPREMAVRWAPALWRGETRGAVLFGAERTGLTNNELDRCDVQVMVTTDPTFSSINLAMSVQIVCYELRLALQAHHPTSATFLTPEQSDHRPVGAEQMDLFYVHLEKILLKTRFLDPHQPKQLMRRLRRLFTRAKPDQQEMNILRGILRSIEEIEI
jgi:tRNA (cytidine32/uridine32-2'-O)-methyltransferase